MTGPYICQACPSTAGAVVLLTAGAAERHEITYHGGAQTCWTQADIDEAARGQVR